MGWRYRAGLFLIATVVVIWVTSAEVTQDIFTGYKQPFAVTYLGASLMVVYIPIAFIKDWLCNLLKRRSSKSGKNAESMNEFSAGFSSPLKHNGGQKDFELEIHGSLTRKDSDADLSPCAEAIPLVSKYKDDLTVPKHDKEVTARQIATYGFYIAPLWFFYRDSLNISKVVAVFVSMAGVAMTTLGKTWATDESQLSAANGKPYLVGDLFGLLSAMSYGLFTVLLKKFAGEGGEGVDVQKLFGYIGLFTLIALWWLDK